MTNQIRKELYIVDEEQKHVQFAKTFLVGWDNTLATEEASTDDEFRTRPGSLRDVMHNSHLAAKCCLRRACRCRRVRYSLGLGMSEGAVCLEQTVIKGMFAFSTTACLVK